MSISLEKTLVPIASTDTTGERTMLKIRSMSWIIRSSTTSTSVPRCLNGASRADSMKRGTVRVGCTARTAALKRSRWPTCKTRLRAARDLDQRFALLDGHGHRLLDQHVRAGFEKGLGDFEMRGASGVTMLTASTLPKSSR